ncbi:MAG TPA: phosphate-starvation-inducible PsiE family protein [Candidatus Microsaccharimonas sp.]|nr:phosphate-starvation-inducible PsiE family protein [Candidatus Microsaccharimonas sp.]
MRLNAHREDTFDGLAVWFATAIKAILTLLLVITTVALCIGMVKAGLDVYHSIHKPLETILQEVLLDTVFIVALVEIMMTVIAYLDDGKVHVRYIVDTILIIMLNEIVSMWFKHPELTNAIALSIIVATLGAIRIALKSAESKQPTTTKS